MMKKKKDRYTDKNKENRKHVLIKNVNDNFFFKLMESCMCSMINQHRPNNSNENID